MRVEPYYVIWGLRMAALQAVERGRERVRRRLLVVSLLVSESGGRDVLSRKSVEELVRLIAAARVEAGRSYVFERDRIVVRPEARR